MMNTRLQNRLTEPEILKIFSDVVEAVCWMHTRNPPLIHRDLKVENILLAGPEFYKLCDFGSASTPKRAPQTMQEIQALEADLNKNTTLQYRAPEMCDVWARKEVGLAAGELILPPK
jgi:serine/threonine protein kinase